MGTISLDVIKSAPSLASEYEDMTNLIIETRVRTGPFHLGIAFPSNRKICAPARLRPLISL